MSYMALYRKFRPAQFQDVKGQEHIVTTLKNQITAQRVGHAYLFCGTRGTGKTTIAKIFAKAVNCENPIEGSPCGVCETCKAITAGNSMNVIEIDAASNNGVDNIREIRDEVSYSPTNGRYKVYIIDEVHMLSMGAFNALLKTLEEPPSYVIFILATTEAHKIPITILSRCQRYDFKRITIDTIAARLQELMDAEQVEVEEKALRYVAKAGDGSMRDALSLLDQCIAFYLGQKLTYEHVLEVLGAVDTEIFSKMLRNIIGKDIALLIYDLEELIMQGREPSQFIIDFTWYLRNLLLIKSNDNMEEVIDISKENLQLLKEEAKMLEASELMRYIRVFSELSNQIKYATQKRILMEIAFIKLCKPEMETSYDSIVERLKKIELQMEQGIVLKEAQAEIPKQHAIKTEPVVRAPIPKAIPEDVQEAVKNWRNILQKVSGGIKTYLKSARLSLGGDNQLLIVFEDEIGESYVGSPERKKELEDIISNEIGKQIEVKTKLHQSQNAFEESFPDLEKIINIEIAIED